MIYLSTKMSSWVSSLRKNIRSSRLITLLISIHRWRKLKDLSVKISFKLNCKKRVPHRIWDKNHRWIFISSLVKNLFVAKVRMSPSYPRSIAEWVKTLSIGNLKVNNPITRITIWLVCTNHNIHVSIWLNMKTLSARTIILCVINRSRKGLVPKYLILTDQFYLKIKMACRRRELFNRKFRFRGRENSQSRIQKEISQMNECDEYLWDRYVHYWGEVELKCYLMLLPNI